MFAVGGIPVVNGNECVRLGYGYSIGMDAAFSVTAVRCASMSCAPTKPISKLCQLDVKHFAPFVPQRNVWSLDPQQVLGMKNGMKNTMTSTCNARSTSCTTFSRSCTRPDHHREEKDMNTRSTKTKGRRLTSERGHHLLPLVHNTIFRHAVR